MTTGLWPRPAPGGGHGVAQVRAGEAGAVRGSPLYNTRGPRAHELQAIKVGAKR